MKYVHLAYNYNKFKEKFNKCGISVFKFKIKENGYYNYKDGYTME